MPRGIKEAMRGYDAVLDAVTSATLVSRYRLHIDGGDSVRGLNAAAFNAPSFSAAGLPPNANDGGVVLNGSTQYLEVPDSELLRPASGTWVVWCKPDTLHNGALISKDARGQNNQDLTLRLVSTGAVWAFGSDGTDAYQDCISATNLYAGLQTLCVVLRFGVGALQLFVNGNKVAEESEYTAGLDLNTNGLRLGYAGYNNHFFDGVLDEVLIFNGRLSNNDIRLLAASPPVAEDFNPGTFLTTAPNETIDLRPHVQALSNATFSVAGITSLTNGTATFDGNSTVTFNPSTAGTDTFTYTVTDALGADTGTVTLTVTSTVATAIPADAQWWHNYEEMSSANVSAFNTRMIDADENPGQFVYLHNNGKYTFHFKNPYPRMRTDGTIYMRKFSQWNTHKEIMMDLRDVQNTTQVGSRTWMTVRNVEYHYGFQFKFSSFGWNTNVHALIHQNGYADTDATGSFDVFPAMSMALYGPAPYLVNARMKGDTRTPRQIENGDANFAPTVWQNNTSWTVVTGLTPGVLYTVKVELVWDQTGAKSKFRVFFNGDLKVNFTGRTGANWERTHGYRLGAYGVNTPEREIDFPTAWFRSMGPV